ncbi:hypothetical protein TMatcc_006699 [Talaromyces marneffei ATCC 18224]
MDLSPVQDLPHHLARRSDLSGAPVYDLKFDYDFRRVPRTYGDSQMRIDFSNEEGYWDAVVDRPGQTKKKKRDLEEVRKNQKRWLEEEWREAYHKGGLSRHELHRRWFGSDVIAWLANLVGVGQAEATVELNHHVDETLQIILMDEQYGPCPFGVTQANIRATLEANVQVDTSFGITIIVTLGSPLDLSNSYLYFKNKGKVTAQFQVDAVASISWNSGDIKLIGLDNFPGATFRVPGVVTIGPNMAVYASADASVTLSAHLQAEVNIVSWDIQQTYPQTNQYPVSALDSPNYDGTQTLGSLSVSASVSAVGELALHLKPKVIFGIVFDSRWNVPDCSVDLVMDGFVIFHAEAGLSTDSDNTCPFTYGIDAGVNIYGQLTAPSFYNWGGTAQVPIASVPRKQITPNTCVGSSTSSKRDVVLLDESINQSIQAVTASLRWAHGIFFKADESAGWQVADYRFREPNVALLKRDTFSIRPIIAIPESSLSCPGENVTGCLVCSSYGSDDTNLKIRDETYEADACPWAPTSDTVCIDSTLSKRASAGDKDMTLSWAGTFFFAYYPPCNADDLSGVSSISKWYIPKGAQLNLCDPTIAKFNKDNGAATCAYVFGSNTDTGGFDFPLDAQDTSPSNFLANTATKVGGSENSNLMALLYAPTNGVKGTWKLLVLFKLVLARSTTC